MPIALAIGWVLAAAAVFFVGWPLFRPSVSGEAEAEEPGRSPLEKRKLDAYAAIKEAELDRRMGKLSDDDFSALTRRYRQQALVAIAAMERTHESAAPRRPSPRPAFCAHCGERAAAGGRFCGNCGRSLAAATARAPAASPTPS